MKKYLITVIAGISLLSSVCWASTDYNTGLVEDTNSVTFGSKEKAPFPLTVATESEQKSKAVPYVKSLHQAANQQNDVLEVTRAVIGDGKNQEISTVSTTEERPKLIMQPATFSPKENRVVQQCKVLNAANSSIQSSEPTVSGSSSVTQSIAAAVVPSELENMSTYGLVGYGTGFFVTPDIVATNWHVVKDLDKLEVYHLGVTLKATVIAKDENNDLALLKVSTFGISRKVTALPLIDIRKVNVGEKVYTVGFPDPTRLGFRPKITDGLINSVAGENDNPNCFQISTPIQPGNSGSPLINSRGQVVGVISKRWTTKQYQNVSYAVKSDHLVNLLLSLPEGIIVPEEPVFASPVEGADIMLLARDAVVTIVRHNAD